jgi:hypothetical protein
MLKDGIPHSCILYAPATRIVGPFLLEMEPVLMGWSEAERGAEVGSFKQAPQMAVMASISGKRIFFIIG